jgi:RNA polymerase sigma factor (sigma-70 family)
MGNGPPSPPRLARAAFAALVERHQHALHAFLRGFTGHDEQARDLVQDTFHDAWRLTQAGTPPFVAEYDDDGVRRWLFHTAYCRAVSLLRRRRPWASLDSLADLLPDERALPFDERIAEREALRAALLQLSHDDVACLLLRVVQGFSAAYLDQIALPEEHPIHE